MDIASRLFKFVRLSFCVRRIPIIRKGLLKHSRFSDDLPDPLDLILDFTGRVAVFEGIYSVATRKGNPIYRYWRI